MSDTASRFTGDPRFPSFELKYYDQEPSQEAVDQTPPPLEPSVLQYIVPESQRRNAQAGQPLTDGAFALYPHVSTHSGRSTSIKGEFEAGGESQIVYAIATGPGLVRSVWAAIRGRRDQLSAKVDVTIGIPNGSAPGA
ncbi:MAG TPA: hypothetical protein VLG16_03845 [Candidatus Saccharimonadales bacterium]|nr:hypothetical protein [Candidatus Saccharimonadales bacterium]